MAGETRQHMVRAAKVAAGLGVTQQTVKKAIKRGDIPGVVIGSLYLVNAAWYASVTSWPPAQEVA